MVCIPTLLNLYSLAFAWDTTVSMFSPTISSDPARKQTTATFWAATVRHISANSSSASGSRYNPTLLHMGSSRKKKVFMCAMASSTRSPGRSWIRYSTSSSLSTSRARKMIHTRGYSREVGRCQELILG
uniref:(northern house mosquito) hypothetical protein n=1 Tax=Culex pipiens TaxID=7175 RepID=A0A8D8FII2_CULPI